jgi:hypothetical protein
MPIPPQPYINIQNGSITGGLTRGQPFYWYNPTGTNVEVKNIGTWTSADSVGVPANNYAQVTYLLVPNANSFAFTESPNQWNAGGQPHISNPGFPAEVDEAGDGAGDDAPEQDVA